MFCVVLLCFGLCLVVLGCVVLCVLCGLCSVVFNRFVYFALFDLVLLCLICSCFKLFLGVSLPKLLGFSSFGSSFWLC